MIEYTKKRGDVVMIEPDKDWLASISPPTEYDPMCSLIIGDVGSSKVLYIAMKDVSKLIAFLQAVETKMDDIQTAADES